MIHMITPALRRRRAVHGQIIVEFAVVASILALALLVPWGGERPIVERLATAFVDLWRGLLRVVAIV